MTSLQEDLNTFHVQRFDITDDESALEDLLSLTDLTELTASSEDNEAAGAEVDLKQLAQKVYTLLKKELRIEQERCPKHKALW